MSDWRRVQARVEIQRSAYPSELVSQCAMSDTDPRRYPGAPGVRKEHSVGVSSGPPPPREGDSDGDFGLRSVGTHFRRGRAYAARSLR